MAYSKKLIVIALVSTLTAAGFSPPLNVYSQTGQHDINEIVKKIDELYRSKSSYSEVEMDIVTPHWQRTLAMKIWTEGMKKTFVRILSPRKEKGVGTLRIGNEMWNYLPKTNKVMKIPPSMMMGSWMGSDFTNDDIVSEISFVDDYTHSFALLDSMENDVIYIKAIPNDGVPVVWAHLITAIRAADYLPVWEKNYDEKGRLMRTIVFSDIRSYGSRVLPSTMEVIPENKEGHKTIVRYDHAEFDIPIESGVFSLRNLRSP
jgi:outer membrane lipoprotein-sorting protein